MRKSILKKIEQVREEMLVLSDLHGMSSEIVLQTSKRLDGLINEYQHIIKNEDKSKQCNINS